MTFENPDTLHLPGKFRQFLAEMNGYFSPEAVTQRSLLMESKAQPLIAQIKEKREKWREKLDGAQDYEGEILKAVNGYTNENEERVDGLREKWEKIPKGGKEELEWTQETIGLAGAVFERLQEEQGKENFRLRDNQLYYVMLCLLNKGEYPFGRLGTQRRGVELPTGEGKTFGFGLIAAIMALRGEKVHIIEPNYVSALDHSKQMGSFFWRFLRIQVGVAVDLQEEKKNKPATLINEKGEIKTAQLSPGRQSFLFIDGKLVAQPGKPGRERIWRNPIVYIDPDSGGFDYLEGYHQNLDKRTALIAEADSLMLDEFSPWIISEVLKGDKAWDFLFRYGTEEILPQEENFSPQDKRVLTQTIFFMIWHSLQNAPEDYFKENDDYVLQGEKLLLSPRLYEKARYLLLGDLAAIFNSLDSSEGLGQRIENWLIHNLDIIKAALEIKLGILEEKGFLKEKHTINLLNEFGFPLEKRKLESIYHVFLQMNAFWREWWNEGLKKWGLEEAKTDKEKEMVFEEARKIAANKIEVSKARRRILPVVWLNKYANLRFSSGSLSPATEAFVKIYLAEVLRVSRHTSIKGKIPDKRTRETWQEENAYVTECLDKGPARIDFYPSRKGLRGLRWAIIKEMLDLRRRGRSALIIVPDIQEAGELKKLMLENPNLTGENIIVVTGKEEIKQRGTVAKAIAEEKERRIIITTWMAHRDVDLIPSQEVIKNGGPEVIVVGLLPTERGLWQALQRVLRSDVPGTRRLMLSKEDLKLVLYNLLSRGVSGRLYQSTKEKLLDLQKKALSGDLRAKKELFEECLRSLRFQETTRQEQLKSLFIRDEKLEEWRKKLMRAFKQAYYGQNQPVELYGEGLRVFNENWSEFLAEIEKQFFLFLWQVRTPKIEDSKEFWWKRISELIETQEQDYNLTYKLTRPDRPA